MMSSWKDECEFVREDTPEDYSLTKEFKEGSLVYLRPKSPDEDPEPALIKYCGLVPELGHGKFYGIEILVPSTQGSCDGCVVNKRYFRCKQGVGTFVRSSRLMPYNRTGKVTESSTVENGRTYNGKSTTTLVLHLKKNCSNGSSRIRNDLSTDLIDMGGNEDSSPILPVRGLPISPPKSPPCPFSPPPRDISPPFNVSPPPNPHIVCTPPKSHIVSSPPNPHIVYTPPKSPPLQLGDRVVWLSDIGPEYGTVRWLGVLPGANASPHTMAGVDFDNPIGTGTGLYNRVQLFTTKKKHASFIPLLGLIRAEDFNIPEKPKTKPNSFDSPMVLLADEKYKTPREEKMRSPKRDVIDSNGCSVLLNNLSLSPTNTSRAELRSPVMPMSPVNEVYYSSPPPPPPPMLSPASPPQRKHQPELGIGSVVEVMVNGIPRYGVIRWVGCIPDDPQRRKVAGIEMEEDLVGGTDGTFHGRRFFRCAQRRAFFVGLSQCQRDGRFQENMINNIAGPSDALDSVLTQPECPAIPGYMKPLATAEDLQAACGKFRGIQGHHNSCYLDATLFSMFGFTSVFDSLLFRPATSEDGPHYEEVQKVLREEIVNPLRSSMFVRADRVMKLRTLLEKIGSVSGMTSEEKDPEELLTSLVAQTLRAEPFLKLSSGQEAFMHQLFVEKDEHLELPSVQQLFEQSFLSSDIKLKEVPPCLIIQMPRFGKAYKMYPRILPSQLLDITDVIESCPRQCIVCGKLARFECRECFGQCGRGLESIAFCEQCLETAHSHKRRQSHAWRRLIVPREYLEMLQELEVLQRQHGHYDESVPHIPRIYMELFAVVCIETSHYVAFVKGGTGPDAPWVFFDSMADRRGEQNGYNIPEVSLCPELPHWLSEQGARGLPEVRDERQLPERAKRLLCDAYMCFYQSPDVAMYH